MLILQAVNNREISIKAAKILLLLRLIKKATKMYGGM
jgi:hypothetical protein